MYLFDDSQVHGHEDSTKDYEQSASKRCERREVEQQGVLSSSSPFEADVDHQRQQNNDR